MSGVIADIARELARRADVPVMIMPLPTAAAVIEAVRSGVADIGFVAPNPQRTGLVLYSQTYMLVQQSALVRADSPLRSVNELDRPGQVIGINTDDSVGVWLQQNLTASSSTRHPRLHAARCRPVAQKRRGDSFCWWSATACQRHARCFRATNARRQLLRGATGCRHTARSPGPPSVDQRCTR
jgi:extracellular solute-binding protein (family 3)